jgi:hydrogenase-4 component B
VDAGADLAERASYEPLMVLVTIAATLLLGRWLVRHLYHGRVRRTTAWDCGYHFEGPARAGHRRRLQPADPPHLRADVPHGAAFPLRARRAKPFYSVKVEDHFWHWLYLPVARLAGWISTLIVTLQGGRIAVYLMYSFITLLVLLLVARP